ncbi:hypothetical protein D3C76_1844870 [compost metagenome]
MFGKLLQTPSMPTSRRFVKLLGIVPCCVRFISWRKIIVLMVRFRRCVMDVLLISSN